MKKISLILISIFTLFVGGLLSACSFKNPNISFSENEIMMSVGDEVSLDEYISVEAIEARQVEFKFSNSDLFEIKNGSTFQAKRAGKTFVYAFYNDSVFASMQVVVKDKFDSPKNFNVNEEDGILSWGEVFGYFEGESEKTSAQKYIIQGEYTHYNAGMPVVDIVNKEVSSAMLSLTQEGLGEGDYTIQVKALGNGYFDESDFSEEYSFSFGYMRKIEESALRWNSQTGVLSWDAIAGEKYRVKFNGVLLGGYQNTDSYDFSSVLENADVGGNELSVVVYDEQGVKVAKESEILTIEKLEAPKVEYVYDAANGGLFRLMKVENAESYDFVFESSDENLNRVLNYENVENSIDVSFEGLPAGFYELNVVAKNYNGKFYQSSPLNVGNIYKLHTLAISGKGENDDDGHVVNATISTDIESDFDLKVLLLGFSDAQILDGLRQGENSQDIEISVSSVGIYDVRAISMPNGEANVFGGENVYVVNSDKSAVAQIVKLDAFVGTNAVTHKYFGDNLEFSVLSFIEEDSGVEEYKLQYFNGSEYETVKDSVYSFEREQIGEDSVFEFVFVGRIEELFVASGDGEDKQFKFRVVAIPADETLSIGCSVEKTIKLLSAPTSAGSGNSTDKTYDWASVADADEYKIEIYSLSKDFYDSNKDETNIDITGLATQQLVLSENAYTFTQVGYYLTRVYALSSNPNEKVSSVDYLQEVFFISEKLLLGKVDFGYNESSYKNHSSLTESSGYYLEIENSDNIANYNILLNGESQGIAKIDGEDSTIYLFTENFDDASQLKTISVVGSALDSTLYEDTDVKEVVVEKLASVEYSDLQFDEITHTVSLEAGEGVQSVRISQVGNEMGNMVSAEAGQTATMNIKNLSSFSLNFNRYGSTKQENVFVQENGKIYLDSEVATIDFERLEAPANLKYYDGNLTFVPKQAYTEYYILDILAQTPQSEYQLSVKFKSTGMIAVYEGQEYQIGATALFMTAQENLCTIYLSRILNVIKLHENLKSVYNQATKIEFAIFAYKNYNDQAAGVVQLSSHYATIDGNDAKSLLEVEKMSTTTLTLDASSAANYVLGWENVGETISQSVDTSYEIFGVSSVQVLSEGEIYSTATKISDATQGNVSYVISRADCAVGVYYNFFVKVKNPYYLESDSSNIISLYQLNAVQSVALVNPKTLGGDVESSLGFLSYRILASETDFNSSVEVDKSGSKENNKNGIVEILGDGEYAFKVVGKTLTAGKITTYYIESDITTWNVQNMSTVKPADSTVVFEANRYVWNAFAEGKNLNNLSYTLVFKDRLGNFATYSTTYTSASIDMAVNPTLFASISSLSSGVIECNVYATLSSYSIAKGGTVYYSGRLQMLNGESEWNCCAYEKNNSASKFATPFVTEVAFVYDELSDAQTPTIKVDFVGEDLLEYDNSAKFNVYINDNDEPIISGLSIAKVDEKYSFAIENSVYNNLFVQGSVMTIKIGVVSDSCLPSTLGSVEIERAVQLENIEFVAGEDGNLTQNLQIKYDEEKLHLTVAGVILKVDYTPNAGSQETEYLEVEITEEENTVVIEDLKVFLAEKLKNGGTVKVSAFINNFADNSGKVYYLSCPVLTKTEQFDVLRSVETVANSAGGFVVDESINNSNTKYLVQCGGLEKTISKDDGFYFEFPNSLANGEYEITVIAIEEGKLDSVASKVMVSLDRVSRINAVVIKRNSLDDLSRVNISWDAVSGANGYIIKMYAKEDVSRENLLYKFEGNRNSYTFEEIFGGNYQSVFDFGQLTSADFEEDFEVVFEVITVGTSGKNNSFTYEFNATIVGNNISGEKISVNEYGIVTFEVDETKIGNKYLYRFITADRVDGQKWKEVSIKESITQLELDKDAEGNYLIPDGTQFEVEIIAMGNATTEREFSSSSADYDFALDSIPYTSFQSAPTFMVNNEVVKVGYRDELSSSITFEMISKQSFTHLYVGLSEDAIIKGEVAQINPTEAFEGDGGMTFVYSTIFAEFIDKIKEAKLDLQISNGPVSIYIWAYRETVDAEASYTISKAYEFKFEFVEEQDFEQIKKMGAADFVGNPNYAEGYEDYANTFAIFENSDDANAMTTLGIFVKITQLKTKQEVVVASEEDPSIEEEPSVGEEEQLFSTIKFVAKEHLSSVGYFADESVYVVNLTEIFEHEDLIRLTGKFKVEFARLQINSSNSFVCSDWLAGLGGKAFEFDRLANVLNVRLNGGNLYWVENDVLSTNYYVYFIEDLKGEDMGEHYSFYRTDATYFNASDFGGAGVGYYIGVQAISENPYILSSRRAYVVDVEGEEVSPAIVKRNRLSTNLVLKDGVLSLEWPEDCDFFETLRIDTMTYSDLAELIAGAEFESPFVFKLKDLLENKVVLQMAFTSLETGSEGVRHIFNINAKYLLEDLLVYSLTKGFDIVTVLTELQANATSLETKEVIDGLINLVAYESHGIGNRRALFDDFFERLQTGSYKLEYRVLGGETSLNSAWSSFKNENNENIIYVNPQPSVKAIKEESAEDMAINIYSVIFKKSNIYDYSGTEYTMKVAENYVLKFKDGSGSEYHTFAISKMGTSYKLSVTERYTTANGLEYPSSEAISVYECDSNGNVVSNGEYLKFYLNYNDGDSILGQFSKVISKMTYEMQIFAVGTDSSISSKSEYFFLTFLGLGQIVEETGPEEDPDGWLAFEQGLGMNKGVFVWTPHNNRNTSVIYKKNTGALEQEEIVDGSMAVSRFSLDSLGYGLFDYIKFVMEGDVVGKTIFVDSEIFQINNVYKLASPVLTNSFGNIRIDDSTNASLLEMCYSDSPNYYYNIYNNVSTSSSFNDVININGTAVFNYEVGTTGLTETDTDYARYKATENFADKFEVMSLGTHLDTTFKLKQDSEKYYIYNLYPNFDTTKSVAVRSAPASINARMMDVVSDLRIEDGVLKWEAVDGRRWTNEIKDTPIGTPLVVDQEGEEKVVYKITWVQYEITSAGADEVETNVGLEHYIYTTGTHFDFADIDEADLVEHPTKTYLKATVQAFATKLSSSRPAFGECIEIVEGEDVYYAYGNVKYKDSDKFVLMGNGQTVNKIDRVAPVEMLEVSEGKLVWKYKTDFEVDESNFALVYTFIVEDETGAEVEGELKATMLSTSEEDGNLFRIEFVEKTGALSEGEHILKVFASKIKEGEVSMIKSFPNTIQVKKLPTISQEEFAVVSDMDKETLDLTQFFADANTNTVIATITNKSVVPNEKQEVVFTSARNKMFIVYSEQAKAEVVEMLASGSYGDYVSTILVIDDSSMFDVSFKVVNETMADVIYGDESKVFALNRTNVEDEIEIVWNSLSQEFEWQYDFNSVLPQAEASKLSFITKQDVQLFNDDGLTQDSGIVLSTGEMLVVQRFTEDYFEIEYQTQTYYIPYYAVDAVEGETCELSSGDIFEKMATKESFAFIKAEDGEFFKTLSSNLVEPIFIIETIYSENGNLENPHNIIRVYETTTKSFQPTIIGKVTIKLRVKLGSNNVQSVQIEYADGKFEDFNLYAGGMGTNLSPYTITNAQEFKNIAYRMQKEQYLVNYFGAISEESNYYFEIQNDIELSRLDDPASYVSGILFKGTFSGVIRGALVQGSNNAPTITYILNGVSSMLPNAVTISEGNIIGPNNQSRWVYGYGASLFEILSAESKVENINLSVEYAKDTTIQVDSLMAGLAIVNKGRINKVNLVSFKNGFTGSLIGGDIVLMSYSGIVAINIDATATISNCKIQTDMLVNDNNCGQAIFIAGIAFTNYARIENCQAGKMQNGNSCLMKVECQTSIAKVQVAGIVNTNASGTIVDCENYFNITVDAARPTNAVAVFMAGIAGYSKGTMSVSADANKGTLTTIQIDQARLKKGDIVAVVA